MPAAPGECSPAASTGPTLPQNKKDQQDAHHESKLPRPDPEVECQKRQRNVPGGQSDFSQGSGRAETMQTPEQERHDPWEPRGEMRGGAAASVMLCAAVQVVIAPTRQSGD